MNSFVLSGTRTLVPSGTRCSCYRGPGSELRFCGAKSSGSRNFTNVLTLTFCFESVRCEQVDRACSEDASCGYFVTRKTFLQCESALQDARACAIARKTTQSPASAAPHHDRRFPLWQLARRGELPNVPGWPDGHHMLESGESSTVLAAGKKVAISPTSPSRESLLRRGGRRRRAWKRRGRGGP